MGPFLNFQLFFNSYLSVLRVRALRIRNLLAIFFASATRCALAAIPFGLDVISSMHNIITQNITIKV